MKKSIIITILLSLSSLLIKAQDTLKSKAQPDSIIKVIPYGEGRHTGYLYTIGGKLETAEDVKIRLLAYAPSAGEYQKAKNEITWSYVSMGGAAISSGIAIAEFAHHARVNLSNSPTVAYVNGYPSFVYPSPLHETSLAGAYILTGVASALLVATFIHFARAAKHGDKALKLYNQRFE
ncbi:hypothetical protein HDF24_18600 [Mucilaginibacter sp. X4EP1]|jgi:hypothetical protein|uniref:hypothetical protein n=1 Tax=Mucilaginibacter sp. X4EP1 TaxID=2723092 RepID=UPI00216985CC|nr:hypothetical protein [Mucilaginibacter sp. X4EP1]MCS3813416.1 hypothetical protein [Mucilaginibacter sp. X4EP1]